MAEKLPLKQFFDKLEKFHTNTPIWNFDEIPNLHLFKRNYPKSFYVSFLFGISSTDTMLPPAICYSDDFDTPISWDFHTIRHLFCECDYCPTDLLTFPTPSGHFDIQTFNSYMNAISPHLENLLTENPVILILLDNANAHSNVQSTDLLSDYPSQVLIVKLVPYSSELIQPLDMGLFSRFEKAFKEALGNIDINSRVKCLNNIICQAFKEIEPDIKNLISEGFKEAGNATVENKKSYRNNDTSTIHILSINYSILYINNIGFS